MKKFIFSFAVLFLCSNMFVFADDTEQTITLKDGSQIKGVLSGIDNGVYTVKTPIIGDVHVAAGDVASITNGNVPAAALPASQTTAAPNMDQQIASTQQQLISNPQSMALLQQMAQDPQIAQALQDPAVVQAVTNHDFQALQSNPAFQKLLADPQMQALIQRLQQQRQGSSQ